MSTTVDSSRSEQSPLSRRITFHKRGLPSLNDVAEATASGPKPGEAYVYGPDTDEVRAPRWPFGSFSSPTSATADTTPYITESAHVAATCLESVILEECIERETRWVQQSCALKVFEQIERGLFECACRLNVVKKLHKVPAYRPVEPEPKSVNLVSHLSRDAISGWATLLADTLTVAEVSMKHLRAPGGVYKGKCVNPFKVPQLQGCSTCVVRALATLQEGRISFVQLTKDETFTTESARILSDILHEVSQHIRAALRYLSPPELRTYQELFHSAVIDNFEPAPPSDVLFSYYVSTDRLVVTAYQMTPKPGNSYSIASFHAESRVETLAQLHQLLNKAQFTTSSLYASLDMFKTYLDKGTVVTPSGFSSRV